MIREIKKWTAQPAVRLAGAYMLILGAICASFSFILYHFAYNELADSLRHQYQQFRSPPTNQLPPPPMGPGIAPAQIRGDLLAACHHLILELIYFNLIIIAVGGFLSYWLAKRTFRPIEDAFEAQSRFTADASHELRTPLAVMQMEIEIARGDPNITREDALALLDSNLEEVGKLNSLSEGLLHLAQSDHTIIPTGSVSLSSIGTVATGLMKRLTHKKRVEIECNLDQTTVLGNEQSLTELLVILLDNAIKYSDAGTKVKMSSRVSGRRGIITITDQGRGIAASDLPHIFDRFYRADKSRSNTDVGGHGLGLSIAHRIVELHQGHIRATSILGSGTTFTISLPLA
jgi:two-component system sensor histidine kinase CiaH